MKELKEKIRAEGQALNDVILKVDSFLNHQVDAGLLERAGKEFAAYFKDKDITRVATIETGGIVPAAFTALALSVPLVIMKKGSSNTLTGDLYHTTVKSFTKGIEYELIVSKKFLQKGDNILIIDDFLANGEAALGLTRVIEMAEANLSGIGIVIEKSFQPGREKMERRGVDVYSLARIKCLLEGYIAFEE